MWRKTFDVFILISRAACAEMEDEVMFFELPLGFLGNVFGLLQ